MKFPGATRPRVQLPGLLGLGVQISGDESADRLQRSVIVSASEVVPGVLSPESNAFVAGEGHAGESVGAAARVRACGSGAAGWRAASSVRTSSSVRVKAGKTTVIRRTLRSVRMPNSVRHLETRRQLFPRGTCLIGTVGACQVLSRADHCVDRLVLGGSLAFLSAFDAVCENDSSVLDHHHAGRSAVGALADP